MADLAEYPLLSDFLIKFNLISPLGLTPLSHQSSPEKDDRSPPALEAAYDDKLSMVVDKFAGLINSKQGRGNPECSDFTNFSPDDCYHTTSTKLSM